MSNQHHQKRTSTQKPLGPGDQVVMHSCIEADKYEGRVWMVKSEPWDLCGTDVVKLEGFRGGFSVEKLQRVNLEGVGA